MVRDTSGDLRLLVIQFIDAEDLATCGTIMEQILFKWTGSDITDPAGKGPNIDARKLNVVEKFLGNNYGYFVGANPDKDESVVLNDAYRKIFEMNYAQLMEQTHLKNLYDKVTYTWDDSKQQITAALGPVVSELLTRFSDEPEQAKQLLREFARTIKGFNAGSEFNFLFLRETFIQLDPSLGWVIDTGGLPVYDQLGQSPDGWYYPHMFGTWGSDAVKGSPTQGDGYINGLDGDDVIYGTDRSEIIYSGSGDSLISGGGGNDVIYAGSGADILDGGAGRDTLFGETGNDTYIFRRGSGQDRIIDVDSTAGNSDTIWLGGNLTPADITLKRSGNDLVLKINDSTDTMTVQDFFRNDGTLNRIEQIQFMDGTVWTDTDMIRIAYSPSDADDTIFGGSGDDIIDTLGGNDNVYGRDGNDSLTGGSGVDRLFGGNGDDTLDGGPDMDFLDGGSGKNTYVFGRGSGQDTLTESAGASGDIDRVVFTDISAWALLERLGSFPNSPFEARDFFRAAATPGLIRQSARAPEASAFRRLAFTPHTVSSFTAVAVDTMKRNAL